MDVRRLVLALAAAFLLAGCVIQQRPQGVFEAEDVPPPPSASTLQETTGPAGRAPSATAPTGAARQRLAVPPAAGR